MKQSEAFFCAPKSNGSCSGFACSSCSGNLPLARQQPLEQALLCPVKAPAAKDGFGCKSLVFHGAAALMRKPAKMGRSCLLGDPPVSLGRTQP